MDKAQALIILSNYCPNLTLADSLNLIADLTVLAQDAEPSPKQWAEAVFSWNDKNTRKIGMIQEVRAKFSIRLKEAIDIVDECSPRSLTDFFPLCEDSYGF